MHSSLGGKRKTANFIFNDYFQITLNTTLIKTSTEAQTFNPIHFYKRKKLVVRA